MPHSYSPPSLTEWMDILLVAVLIYQALLIIRGRRAAQIVGGVIVLASLYFAAVWARLDLLRSVLETLAPYTAFALIVMFQSDIRRVLAQLGRSRLLNPGGGLQRRDALEELLLAIPQLAQEKTGALIVLERKSGLRSFAESGVFLDAQVSRHLLLSIFLKGTALHDGAVIIQGTRIAAAACYLPLALDSASRMRGTRHRAGMGVTEEADCISIIVSEETGQISIAENGGIRSGVGVEELREAISEVYGFRAKRPAAKKTGEARR
ncbi:MAG: TIGR00159 family protein [Candidatus Solibacter usitatus]|nr:TIGR00159 family protein [Candidatus Solibacter usitatus]